MTTATTETKTTETKTSMWEQTEELAKQHEQNAGVWLKLANDKDRAVLVFLGEPYPREVVFVDGKYKPFEGAQKDNGMKPALRVAFNIALYDTKEVKVLEQGIVFFKQVLQMRSKRSLEDWVFEVERHGAAKDPNTTYSILPEKKLTDEERAEFQALELHDLKKLYTESESEGADLNGYEGKSATVAPKRAQAMAQTLKALPREAVDRFLQKFSITRIKDLKAAEEEKALAFIDTLTAEFTKAADHRTEIDPFAE